MFIHCAVAMYLAEHLVLTQVREVVFTRSRDVYMLCMLFCE